MGVSEELICSILNSYVSYFLNRYNVIHFTQIDTDLCAISIILQCPQISINHVSCI